MVDHDGKSINPLQTFFAEFRDLHLYAGLPSTREIAKASEKLNRSVSHSTVQVTLSGKRLPRWGPTEVLVRVLGGEVEHFRSLWMAAAAHISGATKAPAATANAGGPEPAPYTDVWSFKAPTPTAPTMGPPSPIPGSDLVLADESGRSLLPDDPRSMYRYWPDAPPVIQLLQAAFRDGLDINRLLWDVVYNAPSASAAAVALVADNDFAVAMQMMSSLILNSHRRATELLENLAIGQPNTASKIMRELLKDEQVQAKWLLRPAIRVAETGGGVKMVASVLVALTAQGTANDISVDLCEWAEDPARRGILAATLTAILDNPLDQADGSQLLDLLWTDDPVTASNVFLRLIYHRMDRRGRRDADGRLLLAVLAILGTPCGPMLLQCMRAEAAYAAALGGLLLELAVEDPGLATDIAEKMSAVAPRAVVMMLTKAPSMPAKYETIARLIVDMAGTDLTAASNLTAAWLASSYPSVPMAMGQVIQDMAGDDPKTTAIVLRAAVDLIPMRVEKRSSLAGLDREGRQNILAGISKHLSYEDQRKVRTLL
jgi:hypothetical protein